MDEANPVVLQASNTWHIVEDSRRSATALCGQVITNRGAHARLSVVGHEHTCPNCIKIYQEMNSLHGEDKQQSTGSVNISDVSGDQVNIGPTVAGQVGGDVVGGDKVGGDKVGRDKITIGQQIVNFFTGTPDQQRDLRNRQIMLQRVHDFWVKGVLENSLHNEVLIELGMETKPEAVEYPWEMVIQRPDQSNRTLLPGTKMIDVFDESGGTLLILGEPGSGKTTMLLELARQTIARAESDSSQPIPVVFNLSTWTEKKLQFTKWLVLELGTKYNFPKKVVGPLIENDELLLLLDGLDEVAEEQREECVEAINEFRQSHMATLVVCSRIADYEALSHKLKLEGAVTLQALMPEQIEDYLDQGGPELAAVRATLQHDPKLQELAQSPLILSIIMLAYRDFRGASAFSEAFDASFDTTYARRKHMFDTYVKSMFERPRKRAPFLPKRAKHWLNWLAQQMIETSQTEFLLENMQPSWLPVHQRREYRLSVALIFGLIAGLTFGLGVGLIVGPSFGLIAGLGGGLIVGLVDVLRGRLHDTIVPLEAFAISWRNIKSALTFLLIFGLIGGLGGGVVSWLFSWIIDTSNISDWLIIGLTLGLSFGFSVGMIQGLSGIIEQRTTPNQGIKQSIKYGLIVGPTVGLSIGIIVGMLSGLSFGLSIGLSTGLIVGLLLWGSVIEHYTVRIIMWRNDHLPWNLVAFLDYCVDCILLRRVGGGYIFIHRYLMEYFASLTEDDIERSASDTVGRN